MSSVAKPRVTSSEDILFTEGAQLTKIVEVSVVQDRASKQGYIVVSKRENGAQLLRHNMAAMKMVQSFNPNFFLWNVHSSDKKLDETYRLSFDSPEQVKRLRTAFELVIKSAGIKPQMPSPAFAAKSPAMPSPGIQLKESAIKVTGPTTPTSTTTTPATTTATSSPGANPFAGFTFTASKPAVSPGTSGSRPFAFDSASVGPSYASVAAHGATADAHKAGALPTQSSSVKSPGGKDDDKPEEYEPAVDFKPIIDLPDFIEVKTGEEGESKVFSDRVKLFRFDSGQWKERGIGELKILKSDNAARFRVLMRREQVFKVCANHYIAADMKLMPLATSDRIWCYTASDYAEQEVKVEKFAIRFKTADKASEFKATFEACQAEIVAAEKAGAIKSAASSPVKTKDKVDGVVKGLRLAAESDISAPRCDEIDVPEVFSTGDRSDEAGAASPK